MWSIEEYKSKEDRILDEIMTIAKSWRKYEEIRDGHTVVVIEYEPNRATIKNKAIVADGGVVE